MLKRKALACTAKSRLDFVPNQGDAVLVAKRAQVLGKFWVQHMKTAFTNHRLGNDGRHFVHVHFHADDALQSGLSLSHSHFIVGTWVGNVVHGARQRAELGFVSRDLAIEVYRRQSAAMKAAIKGNDSGATGFQTGDF